LLAAESPTALIERTGTDGPAAAPLTAAAETLQSTFDLLRNLGITEYCNFDVHIVRGLAYYTGVVFEIFDRAGQLRAVCGGGRYDNLLAALGGPDLPAVGFGMGDVPLGLLLDEKNKRPPAGDRLDAYIIDAGPEFFTQVLELTAKLREQGVACAFNYRRQSVSKQLRAAASRNATVAVIVGQETGERGVVTIKNLANQTQREMTTSELLAEAQAVTHGPDEAVQ
jgi:histidyl-tRNA synthetase